MSPTEAEFRVIDAFDHPHGGRILRLRLTEGSPPQIKRLRRGVVVARSSGEEKRLDVTGFPTFGGVPSDHRLKQSGRIDICVQGEDCREVDVGWQVSGPV